MAGMKGIKLLAMVLGLLVMVPDTMQLAFDHPLRSVVDRVNLNSGPFLALIITSSRDEKTLKNSTYFEADTSFPYITIAGRRYNFGKFNGESVVYALAGEPLANVGVTVQILLDTFKVRGIINFGSAGTVSNQVLITNVVIPSQVSYTGVWKWQKYGSDQKSSSALTFGDYNVDGAGDNYLEHVEYEKTKLYKPTSSKKSTFWFNVHSDWVKIASSINFGERPTVHIGDAVKVGSSDVYLVNSAYASFLNKKLNITAVDTGSAAVVSTAIANDVPHIVIRGTSNRPGTASDSRLSQVTTDNVLKVVAKFIDTIKPSSYGKAY